MRIHPAKAGSLKLELTGISAETLLEAIRRGQEIDQAADTAARK